jgi:hypothetical protein
MDADEILEKTGFPQASTQFICVSNHLDGGAGRYGAPLLEPTLLATRYRWRSGTRRAYGR